MENRPKMPDVELKAEFLQGLINGDKKNCGKLARQYLDEKDSVVDLYENLLKPSMYMIGDLWEINQISVATEHLASAIVQNILNELYQSIPLAPYRRNRVIVSCIQYEHHQIGSRMVSDVFEKEAWDVLFLGANTPEHSLFEFIRLMQPQVLALSLSIYFHFPYFEDLLTRLSGTFPGLKIIAGGQAFRHVAPEQINKFNNFSFLEDLKELENYIKQTA